MSGRTGRFHSLDVIRGLAALSVTAYHCVNSHPSVHESVAGRALLYGWAGVFLFFPVSGYCIAAALETAENASLGRFLRRRWRRIFPPYWASIGVAVIVGLAALPFNRGTLEDFTLPPHAWLATLTLTQIFTPFSNAISPAYWSLGYEEQFYLVMALLLLGRRPHRALALTAVTLAAAIYRAVPGWFVQGLFLNYWLAFALGCAVYMWLHAREERRYAAIIVAAAAVTAVRSADLPLAVSLGTALAMVALAPRDEPFTSSTAARPLLALGAVSYSLYLIHVPIGGRIANLLVRFDAPLWVSGPAAVLGSVVAAVLFFRVVERRSLPRRSQSAAAVAGVVVRV